MSLSLLKSNELGISNQELFYASRRIFLQNRQFYKRSSSIDNTLKLTVDHSKHAHKKINNSDNKSSSKKSPAKIIFNDSTSYSKRSNNNSSFETFFNTTAQRTSIQTKKEYAKSRERLILSRLLDCTHKKSISRDEIQSDTKGLLKSLEEIPSDQQWRNIISKAPKFSFEKRSPKKTIFEISQKDSKSESQFNNYALKKPDNAHTLSIEKALPRPLDDIPKKRSVLKLKNLKQFLSNKSSIEYLDCQSNKTSQFNYQNEHNNNRISTNHNINTSGFYNPRQQDLNQYHNATLETNFEGIENSLPNTQRLNAYQELFDIELDQTYYNQQQQSSRAPVDNCRYLKWSQQNKRFDKLKEQNINEASQPRTNLRYKTNKTNANITNSADASLQNQVIQLRRHNCFPDINPFDSYLKISSNQPFLPVNEKSSSPEQISHFKVKNNKIAQNQQSRKASIGASLDILRLRYQPKDNSCFDILRKSSIS